MAYEKYYKNNHSGGNSVEMATPFVKVMRNVYAWMALGLLMTALTAVLVASTPSVISLPSMRYSMESPCHSSSLPMQWKVSPPPSSLRQARLAP